MIFKIGTRWVTTYGKPSEVIDEYRILKSNGFKVKLLMDHENNPIAYKYKEKK